MDRLGRFKHINMLMNRVDMLCKTKQELLLFLAKGLFSIPLSVTEQGVVNATKVTSLSMLGEIAADLRDSHVKSSPRFRRDDDSVRCFRCNRTGHKAHECKTQVEDRPQVTCFTCHLPGHKSWACPSRSNPAQTHGKSLDNPRKVGVKSGDASIA